VENAVVDSRQLEERSYSITHNGQSTGDLSLGEFQELRTHDGELYGFVYNGEIYLDETKLSPNAAIHEFTHLWDKTVKKKNPKLWARGKKLL